MRQALREPLRAASIILLCSCAHACRVCMHVCASAGNVSTWQLPYVRLVWFRQNGASKFLPICRQIQRWLALTACSSQCSSCVYVTVLACKPAHVNLHSASMTQSPDA